MFVIGTIKNEFKNEIFLKKFLDQSFTLKNDPEMKMTNVYVYDFT